MKITLKSILLENFKGVESSAINFDSASVNIYGDNATGKTTHLDAFIWGLFGKDSLNSANFEIKALDTAGEAAHNLNHSVSISLDIDGVSLDLKKVMIEKWTRKRGEKSKQFTGHTTTYFVNEVPAKKKDFDSRIADIIDESAFRLLTDARYFNEKLNWKDRRDLLMAVCGDISIDDIISANPQLSTVPEILAGQTPDDARKCLNVKRKAINDELVAIPVRIDEANRSISPLAMPVKDAETGIKALAMEKADLEKEMAALANGGETAKLGVQLQEEKADRQKAVNEFEASKSARIKTAQDQLTYLSTELRQKTKDQDKLDIEIDRNSTATAGIKDDLKRLRAEWHDIDTMVFDGSDTCPTCGQALPADQVHVAIEKFNFSKAEMLKSVNSRGKAYKETLIGLETSKKAMEKRVVDINGCLEAIEKNMAPFQVEIDKINAELCDTTEFTRIINELDVKIQEAAEGEGHAELKRISLQLEANGQEAERFKAVIAQAKANQATQKRIDELTGSEEHLVGELTGIEKQLFLIDEFTRARVDLLESKINGKFRIARFKMFSDQINGGLQETCEVTLDGVPYGSMNSAGRVQVGMDIISALQAHYGVSCPVWIDNRESIVELPEIGAQVVSLIVSEQDKTIRIEAVKHSNEKAA